MGQNTPAPPTALSNASMLAALGVTIMYGLAALVALLTKDAWNPRTPVIAVSVVPLTGLILWLVGMYNLSSAFKTANDNIARSFKGIFNGQLGIIIASVVSSVLIVIVAKNITLSNGDTLVVVIKLLLVALCVCHVIFLSNCISHSRALKAAGLNSMGIVSAAFIIQLVVMAILAIFFFMLLVVTVSISRSTASGLYTFGILLGLTLVVAAVLLIVGMWNVRSELPKAYDGAFKRVGEL